MPDRSLARPILGGAAVVMLSGVAAYFGAGLAQREPPPAVRSAPVAADSNVIESIERRLTYLERRIDVLELRASAVPDSDVPPSKPVAAATKPVDATKAAEPSPAPSDTVASSDDPAKSLADISRSMMRSLAFVRFKLYGDTATEGPARRFAQAVSDSTQLISGFGLRGDDVLEKVRKIYAAEWETGAREIGPLIHGGLERADIATVRERLREMWSESDRLFRPLFDDEGWKSYETRIAAVRKPSQDLLEEYEKARR